MKWVSTTDRPLMSRLMMVPEWKQRYLAHIRTILGERFLLEETTGKLSGRTIGNVGLYGYNPAAKCFECVYAYSDLNAMIRLSGVSKDGRTVELEGESVRKTGRVQTSVKLRLDNPSLFTLTIGPTGGEGPVATMTYTRAEKK